MTFTTVRKTDWLTPIDVCDREIRVHNCYFRFGSLVVRHQLT